MRRAARKSVPWYLISMVLVAGFAPASLAESDLPPVLRDRYGDLLPEGALARCGTVRQPPLHGGFMAVSTDAAFLLATGQIPGRLEVWNAASLRRTCVLSPGDSKFNRHFDTACVCPGDKLVAAGCRSIGACVWDLVNAKPLYVTQAGDHDGVNLPMAFSHDGKYFAVAAGPREIELRHAVWGTVVARIRVAQAGGEETPGESEDSPPKREPSKRSTLEQADPPGDATGSRRAVQLLAGLLAGSSTRRRPWGIRAIAFDRATTRLIGVLSNGRDWECRVWDTQSGARLVRQPWEYAGPVRRLVLSSDGSAAALTLANTTVIIDVASGKPLRKIECGERSTAAVSPDGSLAVLQIRHDNVLRIIDVATGKEIGVLRGHAMQASRIWFSGDGTKVVADADENYVWDLKRRVLMYRRLVGHANVVRWVGFSPNGRWIVSVGGAVLLPSQLDLRAWDASSGDPLWQRGGSFPSANPVGTAISPVSAFANDQSLVFFQKNERVAAINRRGTLRAWCLARGEQKMQRDLELTPADTSRRADQPGQNGNGASDVAAATASSDGRLVVYVLPGTGDVASLQIVRWDTADDTFRRFSVRETGRVRSIDLSPDGKMLMLLTTSAEEDAVTLFDAATGEQTHRVPVAGGYVQCAAFSPDGKTIATIGDTGPEGTRRIRLLDAATAEIRRTMALPYHPVTPGSFIGQRTNLIRFSPDGRHLVTGGDDAKAHVWHLGDGRQLAELAGHHGAVTCVACSPDGTRLASGSADGTVLIWSMSRAVKSEEENGDHDE